jgi:hypothetical protein
MIPNPPKLFCAKRPLIIFLPKVVKRTEENEIALLVLERMAQTVDGLSLVIWIRYGFSIVLPGVRPP